MASNSDKIRMTIVVDRADYFAFHKKVEMLSSDHNKIIRKLIREWISGVASNGCSSKRVRASG